MRWTDIRSAGMTALRRVRSAGGGTVVILTYHRIADDAGDLWGAAIPPARFAEHVAAFAGSYELMTTGDAMRRLETRAALPRRGLCITFDDGYADTLSAALPVLSAHGVPATAFVCSGYVDEPREFWWDELERLVLLPETLPGRIRIAADDARFIREPPADVLAGSAAADTFKQRLHADLSGLIEPLSSSQRDGVMQQLREQLGQPRVVRTERRPLTAGELDSLAASGLVEIGAHTLNHVRLGSRPVEEQREEIEGSKRRLQEMTGRRVESFSYPYGTTGSFTADTERLVREAGFVGAVTTLLGTRVPWGSVARGSDRFALPRTATADVPARDVTELIDRRLGI